MSEAFSIANISISWYSICILVGVIFASILFEPNNNSTHLIFCLYTANESGVQPSLFIMFKFGLKLNLFMK